MSDQLPEHVVVNRAYWDGMADEWVSAGERSWASDEPFWGIWALPESEVRLLPQTMAGMRAIELGCGTGYVSAWMVRRGATVVAIDNSERQLETARRLSAEYDLHIELIHGSAEAVPFSDATFDFAVSEYGAAIWCDPRFWLPEAFRLLKPGGILHFLGHHPLSVVCSPDDGSDIDTRLHRSYFDLESVDWRDAEVGPGGIEFNLPISRWIELFRETGFQVIDYLELRAPAGAAEARFSIHREWARRYPSEQVWKLKKPE